MWIRMCTVESWLSSQKLEGRSSDESQSSYVGNGLSPSPRAERGEDWARLGPTPTPPRSRGGKTS
jgi:hypothetical protein